jgi:hypothetical protein
MGKINVKIFKPFGSSISMQDLPLELMKDFKADLEMIRQLPEKEKQNYRFGFKLAGGLGKDGEFLITPEVMLKWKRNYFDEVIKSYAESHYPNREIERITINSAWYNYQLKNQWNPLHTHSNFAGIQENPSISTVGYLSIPSDMKAIEGEKEHNKFSGCVEWREGSEGMFQFATP